MSCLKTASYATQDLTDMTPEEKTDTIIAWQKNWKIMSQILEMSGKT